MRSSPHRLVVPGCLSALLCSLLFSAAHVAADNPEPAHGRLPDGRAFRVDAAGNQLVDYIAELEENNEALTRQVKGLQEELDTKQHSLERAASGGRVEPSFAEKDLMGGQPEHKTQVASAALREQQCPRCEVCAPPSAMNCPAADCTAALRPVRDELEQTRLNLDIERRKRSTSQSDQQMLVASLQTQLDKKSTELEKRAQEIERTERALHDVQAQREIADAELKKTSARLDDAAQQIQNLERAKAASESDRREAEGALREANQKLSTRPASGEIALVRTVPQPVARTEESGPPSPAKLRALESARSAVLSEANSLNGLIAERDRLFAKYNAGPHRVGLKPSPAVSSRKMSLTDLPGAVKTAGNFNDIMLLRRDVNEIRGRVQEDLAVVSRMSKLH